MITVNERGVIMKNITINSMKLKQINVELIKSALKSKKYSTKNSIARSTGLSVGICGNILKELLLTGEVLKLKTDHSTGGRPAGRFVYNDNYAHVAAIYGLTYMAFESISCDIKVVLKKKYS
jgi:predicted transcriptional regulator